MNKVIGRKKGQGMTEYILIIALIAIVVVVAVKKFGGSVNKGFTNAQATVEANVSK